MDGGGLRSRVRRFESYWGRFFEQNFRTLDPARLSDLHLYNLATNITARETPGRLVPARRGHRAVRRAQRRSTTHKYAKGYFRTFARSSP